MWGRKVEEKEYVLFSDCVHSYIYTLNRHMGTTGIVSIELIYVSMLYATIPSHFWFSTSALSNLTLTSHCFRCASATLHCASCISCSTRALARAMDLWVHSCNTTLTCINNKHTYTIHTYIHTFFMPLKHPHAR